MDLVVLIFLSQTSNDQLITFHNLVLISEVCFSLNFSHILIGLGTFFALLLSNPNYELPVIRKRVYAFFKAVITITNWVTLTWSIDFFPIGHTSPRNFFSFISSSPTKALAFVSSSSLIFISFFKVSMRSPFCSFSASFSS